MKLLILGGTKFLGRHLVDAALTRGHEVTLFNRGELHPELYPQLEKLRGNRDGGLDALRNRNWDAVIDTSGYLPRLVRDSTSLLAEAVELYTFISTVSVYADFSQSGIDESSPVGKLADEQAEDGGMEAYGPLKALCEQAAEANMPGRVLTIRPGLIVGPYDPTDRFTYWPVRVARGGEVLAPDRPALPVQFIDARDLAAWTLQMTEQRRTGVYNAKGPDYLLTMGAVLETCRTISDSDARFTWVSEATLLEHEVTPYVDLPLWVPSDSPGFASVKSERAQREGLTYRPLAETISDTLTWANSRGPDYVWHAGLTPEREKALLEL